MFKCARPGCIVLPRTSCSGCGIEHYCGGDCQKIDWKTHKSLCPILKQLSTTQQSYRAVISIATEILDSKKGSDERVLKHLLSYAEYQFGKDIKGIGYRELLSGERLSNWDIDIYFLNKIAFKLAQIGFTSNSFSKISSYDTFFPYLKKSISLLNPWLIHLDSNARYPIDCRVENQMDTLLNRLCFTEQLMASASMNRSRGEISPLIVKRNLDVAEGHCQRCLAYAHRYKVEGNEKLAMTYNAFTTFYHLREMQGDHSGAAIYAEDCYNLVVAAYDPGHQQVQRAAGILIQSLLTKGDYVNAERFAEVTYMTLRDKKNGLNQEGEELASGAYNLADVIFRQKGNLVRAAELARESLRIRTLLYSNTSNCVGLSCNLLAKILQAQNKLKESIELFERALSIFVKFEGTNSPQYAAGNLSLGNLRQKYAEIQPTAELKRKELKLSDSNFKEARRINANIYGPNHFLTHGMMSELDMDKMSDSDVNSLFDKFCKDDVPSYVRNR